MLQSIDQLALVPRFLPLEEEFVFSESFSPEWVDATLWNGAFPMAIRYQRRFLFAIKLHAHRCVLPLHANAHSPDEIVHVARKLRRRAAQFDFSSNCALRAVVDAIVARRGDDWLCPQLRAVFVAMHERPEATQRCAVVSFEVWAAGSDRLVAGEIGLCLGTTYTSLTGFFDEADEACSGAGNLQIACMANFLARRGFTTLDFGMAMNYKRALGATEWPRARWLEHVARTRGRPISAWGATNKESCWELLAGQRSACT